MAHQVLPSKLVDERITVRFEFMDELEWGETIEEVAFTISVFAGQDPSPEDMLYGSSSIAGTAVSQQLHAGTPGVVYLVSVAAVGSTGNSYEKVAKLAILPSAARNPPLAAAYYSSPPYPAVAIDGFGHDVTVLGAGGYDSPRDSFSHDVELVFASLRDILHAGYAKDALDHDMEIIAAELGTIVTENGYSTDAFDHELVILSATLENKLISYTTGKPDAFTHNIELLSGTLT